VHLNNPISNTGQIITSNASLGDFTIRIPTYTKISQMETSYCFVDNVNNLVFTFNPREDMTPYEYYLFDKLKSFVSNPSNYAKYNFKEIISDAKLSRHFSVTIE